MMPARVVEEGLMRVVPSLLPLLLLPPVLGAPSDLPPSEAAGTGRAVESATVAGVVLGQDGAPLPGVSLALARPDGSQSRLAATGESGVFRLTGLEPGNWDLAATSPGFEPGRAELESLRPGELRQITLTLPVATLRETVEVVGVAPLGALEASSIRESNAKDVGEALGSTSGVWKLRKGGIASDVVAKGGAPKGEADAVTRGMTSSVVACTLWVVSWELFSVILVFSL
jgi:hypothetical protein